MKNMVRKNFLFEIILSFSFLAILAFLSFGGQASASSLISDEDCFEGTNCNADLRQSIVNFVNYFLSFLGLIAVVMIVYAGFLMVLSNGEEDNVGKGKKIILWSLVGIVVVLLSFAIVNFVVGVAEA